MIHLIATWKRGCTVFAFLLAAMVTESVTAAAPAIGQNPRFFFCQMWTQTQTSAGSATHNWFSSVFSADQLQAQDVDGAWVSYVTKTIPAANKPGGHRCSSTARREDAQQMMDRLTKQLTAQPQNQVDHVDWTFSANQVAAPAAQPAQTTTSHCQHIANEAALAQCKAKWGEQ